MSQPPYPPRHVRPQQPYGQQLGPYPHPQREHQPAQYPPPRPTTRQAAVRGSLPQPEACFAERAAGPAPGQPPAQGYVHPAAQQPPAPSRRRKVNRWILSATGVILLLFIVIGTLGNDGNARDTATIGGADIPTVAQPADAGQVPAAAPEPPPTPIVHEGKGDDVITLDKPAGVAVLDFECPKCSRNVVLKTDGRDSLLVNTIGSYTGAPAVVMVTSSGDWTITPS